MLKKHQVELDENPSSGTDEIETRMQRALAMGGPDKLAKRQAAGILNARERIERLVDAGSYIETGNLAFSSVVPEDRQTSTTEGEMSGIARVDVRPHA